MLSRVRRTLDSMELSVSDPRWPEHVARIRDCRAVRQCDLPGVKPPIPPRRQCPLHLLPDSGCESAAASCAADGFEESRQPQGVRSISARCPARYENGRVTAFPTALENHDVAPLSSSWDPMAWARPRWRGLSLGCMMGQLDTFTSGHHSGRRCLVGRMMFNTHSVTNQRRRV